MILCNNQRITVYRVPALIKKKTVIALVSDLHNTSCEWIIDQLIREKPDYIAVNGDLLCAREHNKSIYNYNPEAAQHLRTAHNSYVFIKEASKICTVLFSTGNHELYLDEQDIKAMKELGIIYLDNGYIKLEDIVFGGLSSPYKVLAGLGEAKSSYEHQIRWKTIFNNIHSEWLGEFQEQKGFKILLSHHPEFYDRYIKKYSDIDLILSGHTHGGQIRIFGKGLYAYGQGWFPRYTKGLYDKRMIVSSGLANTSIIPRLHNPAEIVFVSIEPIIKCEK